MSKRLEEDFGHFGIRLTQLYINAITPPPEVQQAIDDRSRMGVFKDMEKLMQMKAAMAMEKAAAADGGAASGMGAGLGLMLPAMFAQYFSGPKPVPSAPDAPPAATPARNAAAESRPTPSSARSAGTSWWFSPSARRCGKNLAPTSKFCSRCGLEAGAGPQKKFLQGLRCRESGRLDSLQRVR